MGDGQRAAARDLFLKQRDQRPRGAEHVAEAHREEARIAAQIAGDQVLRLAVEFGHALGRAHHIGGVHRLVGRDLHKGAHPDIAGGIADIAGADHVGQHALAGVRLDQRHMLQRGGVEDHIGAMFLEDGLKMDAVADAAQVQLARHLREVAGQQAVDLIGVEFAILDQHDLGRVQRGQLAHQLAADGAAGPGDKHLLAAIGVAQQLQLDRFLRAGQHVFGVDRRGRGSVGDALGQTGQGADLDALRLGPTRQRVDAVMVEMGHGLGQQQAARHLGAGHQPVDDGRRIADRTEDRDAVKQQVGAVERVVDNPHHPVFRLPQMGGADEQIAGRVQPDQHHRHPIGRGNGPVAQQLAGAGDHPDTGELQQHADQHDRESGQRQLRHPAGAARQQQDHRDRQDRPWDQRQQPRHGRGMAVPAIEAAAQKHRHGNRKRKCREGQDRRPFDGAEIGTRCKNHRNRCGQHNGRGIGQNQLAVRAQFRPIEAEFSGCGITLPQKVLDASLHYNIPTLLAETSRATCSTKIVFPHPYDGMFIGM